MMWIYAAMAQKERELISARTKAALSASTGARHRPSDFGAREAAQRAAYRLLLEVERMQAEGVNSLADLAER